MTFQYTIFACPRGFERIHDIRQRNAIESWTLFEPKPEIILFGDDLGVKAVAKEFGCTQIDVDRNDYGTPFVNEVFRKAQVFASHDVVCYINSDIIVGNGLPGALQVTAERFPDEHFLVIGRRWDLEIKERIEFGPAWESVLLSRAQETGYLRNHGAIDYFGFRKGMYPTEGFPPFAIGRSAWDNWLVSKAVQWNVQSVETTPVVSAFHQNVPEHHVGKLIRTPEQLVNREYYYNTKGPASGTTKQTLWVLNKDGFKQR